MRYVVEVGWMSFVIDDKDLNKFVEMVQGNTVERRYIGNRYITHETDRAQNISIVVLSPEDRILTEVEFKKLEEEEKARQAALAAVDGEKVG